MRFAFLLGFLLNISIVYGCEVLDDEGRVVALAHPAKRIISLAPDLTELVFAAGAGSAVVGVMRHSDYPEGATRLPVVADVNHVDIERLLMLRPDLIVTWFSGTIPQQVIHKGMPVYFSNTRRLSDIPSTLKRLGCLAGTDSIAVAAANDFSNRYELLQQRYQRKQPISVFYQVWPSPLMTITRRSWINELIELCGGRNVFADLTGSAVNVSMEAVLLKNPFVILGAASPDNGQVSWQHWQRIDAVKRHFIFALHPDWVERAGPRILLGAEEMCRAIDQARQGANHVS